MNDKARRETARTLAQLLNLPEEHAAAKLAITIAITALPSDTDGRTLAAHVGAMMARTVEGVVIDEPAEHVVAELVIGSATPRFNSSHHVAVAIEASRIVVRRGLERRPSLQGAGRIHLLLGACYACAALFRAAIGGALPFHCPDEIEVDNDLLGAGLPPPGERVHFGEAHLVGAGAIGNGFALGLAQFEVSGRLCVCDDDTISEGNLQRCVLFSQNEVGMPKAERLAHAITTMMPHVVADSHIGRLQTAPGRKPGAWLRRLIVAVDSPRARRELQSEIPGEVFDSSTTGAAEVVLHFHRQPTDAACMSCVYHESPEENAREKHIAESLGVSLAEVQQSRVSAESARKIIVRYPHLGEDEILGTPFDTLFKALCSTSKLVTAEGRQVLAPFAFVSVLAGAMQAAEFVRRVRSGHQGLFNEWRLSPWSSPVPRRRRLLERRPGCVFCGNPTIQSLAARLWRA